MTTTIRPCKCGQTPVLTEREQCGIHIMQLRCQCGQHGATLMYTKPEDRARVMQAALDGWNIGC